MGEQINKQFEDFQEDLKNREKNLKLLVKFETNDNIDDLLEELKKKEIEL